MMHEITKLINTDFLVGYINNCNAFKAILLLVLN